MSQEIINTGTNANDGSGDSLRLAMQKINANFTELYAQLQNPTSQIRVSASTTILPSWNGKIVIIRTAGVVLTVPAILPDSFTFDAIIRPSATCNFALTAPKTWVNGTPTLVAEKSTFVFVVDSLNSNEIYLIK